MNKKGFDQIFIYIFVLIVAAIIITFGFSLIKTLREKSAQVEVVSFYNDLQKQTSLVYNLDYKSSREVSLNTPIAVKKICFTSNSSEPITNNLEPELKASILNHYSGKNRKNVFIYPVTNLQNSQNYAYIEHLQTTKNPLCLTTKGNVKVILENNGEVYIKQK